METNVRNYICGKWFASGGRRQQLFNPTTEEVLGSAGTDGVDFAACIDHARRHGGPALRALGFAARGKILASMAARIHQHRDELIELSIVSGGNTRSDAKFDIDGAAGTLGAYASLAESMGDGTFLRDGDPIQLGRNPRYAGQHIRVPLRGAAVHINAFNFPAWGFSEKAAVALLAGMPVITKPATSTCLLAARIVELLVEAGDLPDGALSFLAGSAAPILEHLTSQDVLAFTGSSETASQLRTHPAVVRGSVRVNIEADSLNAAVLGPDTADGCEAEELFLREVIRDMTQKAGQKCTAIRRILVPAMAADRIAEALRSRLAEIRIGDPSVPEVKLGPLATAAQRADVVAGIEALKRDASLVFGDACRGREPLHGVDADRGYFQMPVLLMVSSARDASVVHAREVFGPVATILPYDGSASDAAEIVKLGDGGLVSSVYSDDREFIVKLVLELAPFHGRVTIGSSKVAELSPGPGTVLPQLVHGGPGRAGAGEELGGIRGLSFYTQRTALQGYGPILDAIVAGGFDAG